MDLRSLTIDKNADNNRYQLMNKLLNFASEINAKGDQAHDLIKRMASGEAIQVKLLYKDTITISDYAKLIFNANTLPTDVEHSLGFFRRFLIIPFDRIIDEDERDPDLANKIISTELDGVLNWVIEGTQRLQRQKKFSQCRKSDEILSKYKLDSDVVAIFIDENCYLMSQESARELKDLHEEFMAFVSSHGYKPMSDRAFAKRLRAIGFRTDKPDGSRTKVYIKKKVV